MDARKMPFIVVTLAGVLLASFEATATAQCLFSPADVNENVTLDGGDVQGFVDCLVTGTTVEGNCACADMNDNGVVDVDDIVPFVAALLEGPAFLFFDVQSDDDDGTEVNDSVWHADGHAGGDLNRMGKAPGESNDAAMRFHLRGVQQGDTFVYARLIVPGTADGQVDAATSARIVGIDQTSPPDFSVQRPSQLPKTSTFVDWDIGANWPAVTKDYDCSPLRRYSPDISPIINEIVAGADWGQAFDGETLALVVEDDGSAETNFMTFQDYRVLVSTDCPGAAAPRLELYRTVRSTFLGTELLGRPTSDSVTVNAYSLLDLEVFIEYGTSPGVYTGATPSVVYVAQTPIEDVIAGLAADTTYYYRLRYRQPGAPVYEAGPRRSFHTQRAPGSAFTFTMQSDPHLQNKARSNSVDALDLYRLAVQNARRDNPDFHIDLGDTFHSEFYKGRDVLDLQEAVDRHLAQRPFFGYLCHSAPFFFALGNHEGEQGWRVLDPTDNVAVWAQDARKLVYPLPLPDPPFYTGSADLRENYYAWQWGDALFVVLDPYWYTTIKPHDNGGGGGSRDNWDWTLGLEQYQWLVQTLQASSATFKFVISHQVAGGVDYYGRGGVEAASHALGGTGSFEWGGEDTGGNDVFDTMRPGWGDPVHQVMVDNNVTIFFHGHDHVFVKQDLDGIVYQECPQPSSAAYGSGFYSRGHYWNGDMVENSGHLRVTVSPAQVLVEYVRAWLPGDGTNGEVAYSYTIP